MTETQKFFELFYENLISILKGGDGADDVNRHHGLDIPRFENLRYYNFQFEGVTCNITAKRDILNGHIYCFNFFKNEPYYNVMLTWVAGPEENDDYINLHVSMGNTNFGVRKIESLSDFLEHPNVKQFLCGNKYCENGIRPTFIKQFKTVRELLSEINLDLIRLFYTGEDQVIAQKFKAIFKPLIRSSVKNSRNMRTC